MTKIKVLTVYSTSAFSEAHCSYSVHCLCTDPSIVQMQWKRYVNISIGHVCAIPYAVTQVHVLPTCFTPHVHQVHHRKHMKQDKIWSRGAQVQ